MRSLISPTQTTQGSDQAAHAHIGEHLKQQDLPLDEDQHLEVLCGRQASKNTTSMGKLKPSIYSLGLCGQVKAVPARGT